jgi:transcriptional regulator with AAA-type ATPase domain
MTRKEKVFNELKKICENITLKKIEEGFCEFDATIIGKKAGVSRNNTSKELNVLLSEKIVIKIQGRPVCFFDRNKIEEILDITLSDEQTELKSMSTLINLKEKTQDSGLPPQNVNTYGIKYSTNRTDRGRKNHLC